MAKADVKHNYYADLELPATASLDDIKKQYRKLAMLYHPDRNAGKEDVFVPKFQAIQTAHEILGDAAQKQKYDQDRRKAGCYPTFKPAPAPTGNRYTANSPYPPPPRRTQPKEWTRPQASNATSGAGSASTGAATGAERFTNFPKGAPTGRKDPAQDKGDRFKAWQNMSNAQDRQAPFFQAAPQPPPSSNRPRRPPRNETGMPSEEEIKAGMNYRKPPSKFDADRAEQQQQQHQAHWSAFQSMHAGKAGINRSNTAKTPRKQGFDPNAPESEERPSGLSGYAQRHRSEDFGRPPARGQPYPPPPSRPPPHSPISPTSSPKSQQRPFADPLRPFKNREDDFNVPFTEGNRERTPYAFSSERLRRSASTRDTTKLSPGSDGTARARSTSPLGRQPHHANDHHETGKSERRRFVDDSDSCASNERVFDETEEDYMADAPVEGFDSSSATENERRSRRARPEDRPKKTPTLPNRQFRDFNVSPKENGVEEPADWDAENDRFTLPTDDHLFQQNARSRSEENVNTNFSPNGWSGTFTGNSNYFEPPRSTGQKAPKRAQDRKEMRSATTDIPNGVSSDGNEKTAPRPFGSDGMPGNRDSAAAGVRFSKDQWEKTFQDASWTWPHPHSSKPPSPVKEASNAHAQRLKKTGEKFVGPNVNGNPPIDVNEAGASGAPHAKNGALEDDGDAMDIDPMPPAHHTNPASRNFQANFEELDESRAFPIPPPQRQQRQHHANGQPRKPAPGPRRASRPSADHKFNTKLDDLAHVEPITNHSADGLNNLSSISSTLPFQSQASTTPPFLHSHEPQPLPMPPIPKAPEPPHKLSKQSFHAYADAFAAYLRAFHAFNETMLVHFAAREKQAQSRMLSGMGWLEAVGETTAGHSGFASYLQAVREDEGVRMTWSIGCERHADACKGFEKVRERVVKAVSGGGLSEM